MTIDDILDLTLREILEKYCTVFNAECCFYYGIVKMDDIDELYEKYNIEEYEEAFMVESLVSDELLLDCGKELLTMKKLEKIMDGLDISKKE